jgi:hypothetical protein
MTRNPPSGPPQPRPNHPLGTAFLAAGSAAWARFARLPPYLCFPLLSLLPSLLLLPRLQAAQPCIFQVHPCCSPSMPAP